METLLYYAGNLFIWGVCMVIVILGGAAWSIATAMRSPKEETAAAKWDVLGWVCFLAAVTLARIIP